MTRVALDGVAFDRVDATTLVALRKGWRWLLGEAGWTPILFSAIGDVFVELRAGTVWWLSTATGELEQVAETQAQFAALLDTDAADAWFLPGLVQALRARGQALLPGQCYSYSVFPVFAEGSFSAENMYALEAAEHFALSGELHRQIAALPDGSAVTLWTTPRA